VREVRVLPCEPPASYDFASSTRGVSAFARSATVVGMSNIDDLLKYEQDVIGDTRRALVAFSPELIEALDPAMGMYTTFGRVAGQGPEHAAEIAEGNDCAKQLGAKDEADLEAIRATPTGDPAQAALLARLHAAEERLEAKLDRAVILLLMGRTFSRGV